MAEDPELALWSREEKQRKEESKSITLTGSGRYVRGRPMILWMSHHKVGLATLLMWMA
jgi:hypothetical protein